jgi:hypothetical protein
MKVDKAIGQVQSAESDLAVDLRRIGERHAAEHDLYHLGHTLAKQCTVQVERLTPFLERYGASDESVRDESPESLEKIRKASGVLAARSELSGLLLMRDLRNLYLSAQEAELAWVILVQTAQAVKDQELLEAAALGHDAAEMRGKWLRTRIKVAAPQVYATG